MLAKVVAIVPIKLSSRRLPNKNFLKLGDKPLSKHILDRLLDVDVIDEVYCYSSQPQIMSMYSDKVRFLSRPSALDSDSTLANELFGYAVEKIDAEIVVICHATGPFIRSASIEAGVNAVLSGDFDCAFSVMKARTYAWYKDRPLNYDPSKMVQTQDLNPVYFETSGFYVFRKNRYLKTGTRVGDRPFFVEVDVKEGIDIDEPKDFNLARALLEFDPEDQSYSKDDFFVSIANRNSLHKNISHICFDFDGVLIDSIPVMEVAWNQVQQQVGIEQSFSMYAEKIGLPFFDILRSIGIAEERFETIKHVYEHEAHARIDSIGVFDGVVPALTKLSEMGMKISIATSKSAERTSAILDRHFKTVSFDIITTPESVGVGRGKPNPDQLLKIAVELGVDPENSLYVGDMDVDRKAAQRAGFQFVHAKWGYGQLSQNNGVWFNSMSDLVKFLDD